MDDRLVGITRKDPVLASTISKRVRSVVDAMARERHQRVKDDELYDDDDQSDARREDVARAVMREIAECLV